MTDVGAMKRRLVWAQKTRPVTMHQQRVLDVMKERGLPVMCSDIEKELGWNRNSVKDVMEKLKGRGLVMRFTQEGESGPVRVFYALNAADGRSAVVPNGKGAA